MITRERRKALPGTCIKDPWTKPKRGRIESGRWGWVGWGKVVVGKWRQLYLNNNNRRYLERREIYFSFT